MLKRPYISEKSMKLVSLNLYTFEVDRNADKKAIAKIVAQKYKVDVVSVKTINVKGRVKSQRRVRKSFMKPSYKKAIVQLKKGQKLPVFEAIQEEEPEGVKVTTGDSEPVTLKEKKDLLGRTKVRVEKGVVGAAPTTQRKVITGK